MSTLKQKAALLAQTKRHREKSKEFFELIGPQSMPRGEFDNLFTAASASISVINQELPGFSIELKPDGKELKLVPIGVVIPSHSQAFTLSSKNPSVSVWVEYNQPHSNTLTGAALLMHSKHHDKVNTERVCIPKLSIDLQVGWQAGDNFFSHEQMAEKLCEMFLSLVEKRL